jgi:hypothetical protein
VKTVGILIDGFPLPAMAADEVPELTGLMFRIKKQLIANLENLHPSSPGHSWQTLQLAFLEKAPRRRIQRLTLNDVLD